MIASPAVKTIHAVPSVTSRQLHLSRLAESIAVALHVARQWHDGGDGSELWAKATDRERLVCRRAAEQAVTAVNDWRVASAEDAARHVLDEMLADAKHTALVLDECHSQRHLIAAALDRMAAAFRREDPAVQVVRRYQHVLTHGGQQ